VNRFRQWLQWFTGVLSHEKAAQSRHSELMLQLRNQNQTSTEILELIGVINGRLASIENMFIANHVPRGTSQPKAYDWEQVQVMALEAMLENPPKEDS